MFDEHSNLDHPMHSGNPEFIDPETKFQDSNELTEEQLSQDVDDAQNSYDRASELLEKASQDETADLESAKALQAQRHEELMAATKAHADFLESKNQTH